MKKVNQTLIPERIFAQDEMLLRGVSSSCTLDELLKQDGVFFLKELIRLLKIDSSKVKHAARKIRDRKRSAWQVMGARKIWNHWLIRMKTFAPYYKRHLKPRILRLEPPVNSNNLLQEQGQFFLTDVCRYLPFSAHQLRYQAKNNPNAKQDFGIWKDPALKAFIVDMEVFSKWVKHLWAGHFNQSKPKEGGSCPIDC